MQEKPRESGERVRREIEEILAKDEVKAPLAVAAPRPARPVSRIGRAGITSGHLVVLGMVTLIAAGFLGWPLTLPFALLGAGLFAAGYWMSVRGGRKANPRVRKSEQPATWWRGQKTEPSQGSGNVVDFREHRPSLLQRWFKRGDR